MTSQSGLTVELPANVHRDLVAYSDVLVQETEQEQSISTSSKL